VKTSRQAAFLAGVAAAYYLGAQLGFVLRFPPATTSVLWPPNALLTAALLLTSPNRFWLVVLAALPAHVLVQLQADLPPPLIASLFITNCAEALLAAGLVHAWSDDPTRFDSLRRVLIFVGGAVLASPALVSFADAAAVQAFRHEPFSLVFGRRIFSNVLGQLCLVPSAVMLVRQSRAWRASASRSRRVEAALLGTGLLAFATFVFYGFHYGLPFEAPLLGDSLFLLPLLMPPLLLAAVRFGTGGASLSLLACALLAAGTAVVAAPHTPDLPAEQRVRAVQVFLIVVGVPLLCLSALVEDRRNAAATVSERLRFEGLVSEIAAAFVHVPSHEMPGSFATRLERLARFLDLDAAVLWQFESERRTMVPVASWFRAHDAPGSEQLPKRAPLSVARLLQHEPAQPNGAPRSFLALPLVAGNEVLGSLELVAMRQSEVWTEPGIRGARLIADVFASALARRRAEDALRASESMKSAVLNSLTNHVAVLDRTGRIIAVNENWTRFARENGIPGADLPHVGDNYLTAYPRAGLADAPEARLGIEGVLAGELQSFDCDYVQASSGADRWFHLMVVPLHRPEGGAVLSHSDITARRQAETQAQKSRDELAHYLRVSTIGELTTSIAHQLNQPLAAILANAQTARRLLQAPESDERSATLDEILEEIVAEERRADEVIRGVRQLLRKEQPVRATVDLNALVDDCSKLLATDVMVRGATLRRRLAGPRLLARGDRVQLQQVLLNLMLNALEAVADCAGERVVQVETEERPAGMACIAVSDSGPGLRPGRESEVFTPFYSTKPHGMGMGLSIARSIVEAHGGSISAAPGTVGAMFCFTLPIVREEGAPDVAQAPLSLRKS
jgi:signal transduction histidine kinase/integral membrane sensor domain MASE1